MMFVHQPGSGIKLPANDSGGVITAFYLKSEDSELDFEFLGNRKGKPIRVQTNVFLKGKGSREQMIHLCYFVMNIPFEFSRTTDAMELASQHNQCN
ncbi:hypothetical protein CsSME_00031855 [Camellia sinensis var. sinensis]